jgi:hypothetical protein
VATVREADQLAEPQVVFECRNTCVDIGTWHHRAGDHQQHWAADLLLLRNSPFVGQAGFASIPGPHA